MAIRQIFVLLIMVSFVFSQNTESTLTNTESTTGITNEENTTMESTGDTTDITDSTTAVRSVYFRCLLFNT